MNTAEALSLLNKLREIEKIAQAAASPEGRWELLQHWLKDNSSWEKQINIWVQLTPDAAFVSLKSYVAQQADIHTSVLDLILVAPIQERAISAIEIIQTLYKERRQLRKEIA